MSEFALVSAVCVDGGCQFVYRSPDGLVGLHVTSSSGRPDLHRYFLWALPDAAPTYATEAEARAAYTTREDTP